MEYKAVVSLFRGVFAEYSIEVINAFLTLNSVHLEVLRGWGIRDRRAYDDIAPKVTAVLSLSFVMGSIFGFIFGVMDVEDEVRRRQSCQPNADV